MAKTATKVRAARGSKVDKAIAKRVAKAAPGNATAKRAKANDNLKALRGAEIIESAVNARTGNGMVVTGNKGTTIVVTRVDREVNKLALVGQPLAPLSAYLKTQPKPEGRLARGVDAHNSPHSAKAVADNRAASAKGRKARGDAAAVAGKPAPAKAAKAARKAERAARHDPKTKVTVLVKPKDAGVTLGRLAKLQLMAKCRTLGDFLGKTVTDSAGRVHTCKMDAVAGMLRRNHIRLG